MNDKDKKNRWAKSLDEAGLLDEIEDGWVLPENLNYDATIHVEGRGEDDSEDPAASMVDENVPFAVPVPTIPPLPMDHEDQDKTPIEGEGFDNPGLPGPFTKSSTPPDDYPLPELSPPRTRSTLRFHDEEADRRHEKADAESFVSAREARISVVPETVETGKEEPEGAIWDEPPIMSDLPPLSNPEMLKSPVKQDDERDEDDPLALMEEVDEIQSSVSKMRDHYDMGDYTGALEIAGKILDKEPDNKDALEYRDTSRGVLTQMYESRIGSLDRVPVLAIDSSEIIWRNLDPAAGFVLSRIDGMMTFEDLLDISGLPKFETYQILNQLLQDGIIE
ncbi:MAG: hypothetical protein GY854_09140 [Deltaproteobacteria bacterium]|nr:hypothetical protein [Deltaproteobacteria bacterium]